MKITASSTLTINKLSISWLATTDSNIYIEEITINCVTLAANAGSREDPLIYYPSQFPGIPGVGEKTAAKLLKLYDTLEGVLENAEKDHARLKEYVLVKEILEQAVKTAMP